MNLPLKWGKMRIPVLLYHQVDVHKGKEKRFCITPEMFDRQMGYLYEHGYKAIRFYDLIEYLKGKPLSLKPVIITFDDGHYNNYSQAFSILRKYGFIATIFLTTDLISENHKFAKDQNLFLSWEDIREMKNYGIDFQSHGCAHRSLTEISLREAKKEVSQSKIIIEENIQDRVDFFAYPFGDYSEKIKQIVANAGYLGACGGPPEWEGIPKDFYEIGRTEILGFDSLQHFAFKVRTGYSYYYYLKKKIGRTARKVLKFTRNK